MNYKDKRWLRIRERVLKRDNYLCKECVRYGIKKEANTVHHIFPASKVKEYRYLEANLISLCPTCHNRMHERQSDELTIDGERLLERNRERIEKSWQAVKAWTSS